MIVQIIFINGVFRFSVTMNYMGVIGKVSNEDIGRNLTELRKRAGMSMDDLANEMRKRGYNWNRTIVFNIEHAERQLKLSEAADILSSLGIAPTAGMEQLLATGKETEVKTLVSRVLAQMSAIALDYNRLSNYRNDLKTTLGELQGDETELTELINAALDKSSDEKLLSFVKYLAKGMKKQEYAESVQSMSDAGRSEDSLTSRHKPGSLMRNLEDYLGIRFL